MEINRWLGYQRTVHDDHMCVVVATIAHFPFHLEPLLLYIVYLHCVP